MAKKKIKEKRLALKLLLCLVYLIVITILFTCSYKLFEQKNQIVPFQEVNDTKDYTYIDIFKMSEKFAFYEEKNIGFHFVIEKEETGLWHTYIIAIDENDYNLYKDIIDYTYERTDKVPKIARVYGYPILAKEDIKDLAIKNIPNFVPAENEVVITKENYDNYLTNSYLDTTKPQQDNFSLTLSITLILLFITMLLLVMTIMDKDKIVDNLDERLEKELKKQKKIKRKKKTTYH